MPLGIEKMDFGCQYSIGRPCIRTQHWALVIFIEAGTKSFVHAKVLRILEDRFQDPTAKTLHMSSREEKANSKKPYSFPFSQRTTHSAELFAKFKVLDRFIPLIQDQPPMQMVLAIFQTGQIHFFWNLN